MYLVVKVMGPEDEEMARQCSDYLNYIFYKENDGFLSFIYSIQRCINPKEWNPKSILG